MNKNILLFAGLGVIGLAMWQRSSAAMPGETSAQPVLGLDSTTRNLAPHASPPAFTLDEPVPLPHPLPIGRMRALAQPISDATPAPAPAPTPAPVSPYVFERFHFDSA